MQNSKVFNRIPLFSIAVMGIMAVPALMSCMAKETKVEEKQPVDNVQHSATIKRRIGVIGAGSLGGTVGKLLVAAGHEVMFSSRHPEKLKAMAEKLGSRASVGSPKEAAAYGDIILLSVPFEAVPQVTSDFKEELKGKVILDATNPWHSTSDLAKEAEKNGIAETISKYLAGTKMVRVFSAVDATVIEASAKRPNRKIAIPIAGDNEEAISVATQLVRDVGCDPVVVGNLASSKKFDPGHSGFRAHLTAPELRKLLGVKQE